MPMIIGNLSIFDS